jgi:hypothetical protein
MNSADQRSSLFWLLFAMAVGFGSLHLGIGTVQNPGMGMMAFGASVLLGALSVVLFFQASLRKEEKTNEGMFDQVLWKRPFIVLIALLIYSKLMTSAGYLISTFLLMSILFWIVEKQRLWQVLVFSFLTTLITYYFFSKWLNCQFPDGLFGL